MATAAVRTTPPPPRARRSPRAEAGAARASIALLLLVGPSGCVEYTLRDYDRVDVFRQSELNAVDLLLVVDNSLSMLDHHAHIAENFDAMVYEFEQGNVDWRLLVTTTETSLDTYKGRLAGTTDELLLTRADGELISELRWDRAFTADVAWQLDGGAYAAEAAAEDWCEAEQRYGGGAGTPGGWNPGCDGSTYAAPAAGADDGPREPEPGELVVTEVMALTGALDSECEWLELTNLTDDTLALDGLTLTDAGQDGVELPSGLEIAPYQALVVGRSAEAESACGTPVDLAFPTGLVLADGTRWVEADTPDAEERFGDLVAVGAGSLGLEMGLQAATLALSEPYYTEQNGAFLREEASLSVLFVSDEDDMSPLPVRDYVTDLMGAKGYDGYRVPGWVNLIAVTGVDEPPAPGEPSCSSEAGDAAWGLRYLEAAALNGGTAASICDNFHDLVSTLGLTRTDLLQDFVLTGLPKVDSVVVELHEDADAAEDGEGRLLVRDQDYRLTLEDADADPRVYLRFDETQTPPAGSALSVRYTLLPGTADIRDEFPGEDG